MTIEAAQRFAHHVDRHDAGLDRMFFTQAVAERSEQVLRRHVDLVAQAFRRLLEFGKIISVGLDQVAYAFDRICFEPCSGALVAVGHLRRDQRLAAPRFGVGGIEPLQRMRHAGAKFGEIAQLLLRQIDLAKQRIGKNLVQFGEEAVLVGGGEIAQVEIVGLREAQQDLRGDRTLVALDQVDVTRRDAESLRDLGLRQSELLADAPEARADEEFFARVRLPWFAFRVVPVRATPCGTSA